MRAGAQAASRLCRRTESVKRSARRAWRSSTTRKKAAQAEKPGMRAIIANQRRSCATDKRAKIREARSDALARRNESSRVQPGETHVRPPKTSPDRTAAPGVAIPVPLHAPPDNREARADSNRNRYSTPTATDVRTRREALDPPDRRVERQSSSSRPDRRPHPPPPSGDRSCCPSTRPGSAPAHPPLRHRWPKC